MIEESASDLVARAVRGDELALQRLLLRECRRLTAHVAGRVPIALQGVIGAEDIAQETFAEAFRSIAQFTPQGEDSFYHWLARIAEHRLLDAVKAQRTAKRGGGRKAVEAAVNQTISLLEMVNVTERTPSRSAAGHEAVAAVQEAMALLPDDYREAIRLRHIEGLPAGEVAARMERTEQAVHMLCHRGIRQLHALMGRTSDYLSVKE